MIATYPVLSENAMDLLAGCAGITSEGAELMSDGQMKQVVDRWFPAWGGGIQVRRSW